jgi:hypothetical protein
VTEKPSPYWIKVKNTRYSQAEAETNCSSAPPYTVPKWLKSTSIHYNPCQLRTIRVANETIHHANNLLFYFLDCRGSAQSKSAQGRGHMAASVLG